MTIKFNETSADANKGFRIGGEQSLFVNNVVFNITGVKFGNYTVIKDDGTEESTKYASTSQAILFTTSIGEDLSLNRLLKRKRVIYNKQGEPTVVPSCDFQAQLRAHLESLGRRTDDSSMLKGTVQDVANKALEFFKDKKLICIEIEGTGRDDKNRPAPLLSPCIQFSFKN